MILRWPVELSLVHERHPSGTGMRQRWYIGGNGITRMRAKLIERRAGEERVLRAEHLPGERRQLDALILAYPGSSANACAWWLSRLPD